MEETRNDELKFPIFPTLSEIQKDYKYMEPRTHDNFSSVIDPIFTEEGHVIEKETHRLRSGKSLFTHKTIKGFESSDLPKIEEDFTKIENAYSELHEKYCHVTAGYLETIKIGKSITQEKEEKIKEHEKTISELIINHDAKIKSVKDEMRSEMKELIEEERKNNRETREKEIKNNDDKMMALEEKFNAVLAKKDKKINKLEAIIDSKDNQIDSLKSDRKRLILENSELRKNGSFEENQKLQGKIITLEQDIRFAKEEIVGGDRWQLKQQINLLTNENKRLKEQKNGLGSSLHNDPFSNQEPTFDDNKTKVSTKRVVYGAAVGVKTDRWQGFKHTINWVDDNEIPTHNKKLVENNLKACAYFGDNAQITNLLNAHKDIVNGRGEPDALRSAIFGLEDRTALMIAAKEGHTDCVQTLINYNANVNYLDRNNKTALDYAHKFWKKHKNSNVRQPLWQNGAVPSSCCEVLPAGKTPLK